MKIKLGICCAIFLTNASAQNTDPLAHLRVREMPIMAPYVGPADPAARAADARQKAWEITNLGRDLITGEPTLPVFDRQDGDESDLAWTMKFKSQCKNGAGFLNPYKQICISAAGALVFPARNADGTPVEIIAVGDNPVNFSTGGYGGSSVSFFFTPTVNAVGQIADWRGSVSIVDPAGEDAFTPPARVFLFN